MSALGRYYVQAVNPIMCCCNCCNCCRAATDAGTADSMVCYCSRVVEVPMRVYYGPGVTEDDLLEQTNAYLASIAAALERMSARRVR